MTNQLASGVHIVGVAVDATSGTFLLVDPRGQPLTRGLMYNDLRAADLTDEVAGAMRTSLAPFGIQVAASFALTKIFHLARTQPTLWDRGQRVVHQTDWIVGMLCGRYDITDVSTALKTGADPASLSWPSAIESALAISRDRLPKMVLPGTPIGTVTTDAARATGLPAGTPVVAGCTDGTAGALASGATRVGDVNVTLGSTLVFKAISDHPLLDPQGAVYNHRHPGGGYLPGAASSTGAEWIRAWFSPDSDLEQLGHQAARQLPTGHLVYPLVKRGERFPFACSNAEGFGQEDLNDVALRFAAGMEGVAMLERMGIERLEQLGLRIEDTVYTTGGGTAGQTWLRIRAAVNRRRYCVPLYPDCAVGAAVLAAMPTAGGYEQAAASIVRSGQSVEPDAELAGAYDELYPQFLSALKDRGYC
jgi:xylulokinase